MNTTAKVIRDMMTYYQGDVKRINHFIKVFGFAKTIGELENLEADTQIILEVAAITHDIGIKVSEAKYADASGKYQQIEGPVEAKKLLGAIGVKPAVIDRCCWLIAHHHTYNNIVEQDHQILVEADFLVNIHEGSMGYEAILRIRDTIFKTKAGIQMLDTMYVNVNE